MLATLVALSLGVASAQVCRPELEASVAGADLARAPTGVDAAIVLARAVDLVEPALPRFANGTDAPVQPSDPAYDTLDYLAGRRLLPASWAPSTIDADTWSRMLTTFASWYELPRVSVDAPATLGELIDDVSGLLSDVSGAIRPAALLATDPNDGGKYVFWAIIWNWTRYPRLIVHRTTGERYARPLDLLPNLGNCAMKVTAYIAAPEGTARSLFLTHNSSRMFIVASDPPDATWWPLEIPHGYELDAFTFNLPELAGVDSYAATFDGPEVGALSLLSMLPRVRTNISPFGLGTYLQVP